MVAVKNSRNIPLRVLACVLIYVIWQKYTCAQHEKTVIMPMEEIRARNRQDVMTPLLKEGVSAEDPRLIQAIRDHFIDPPSTRMSKMSSVLIKTPQATAIRKLLKNKSQGFFIECGGLDGEWASNTMFFEKKLNWTGILIEMDPSWYHQLEGKNRKAYGMNACLSPYTYPVQMDFEESMRPLGTLIYGKSETSKPVYCFPLLSVLLALNQTHIDYFSLDVEGFEFEILKTIPFHKLDITTLSVEYINVPDEIGQGILDLMEASGYKLHLKINARLPNRVGDYIFVKKSFSSG